jgi:hypothetical protein
MCDEPFATQAPDGCGSPAAGVVGRDRQVQFPAHRLDPEVVAEVIDHRVGLVPGWSSSFAKNTEAALRISFARHNSAISLRSCVSSVHSAVVSSSGRLPWSASARHGTGRPAGERNRTVGRAEGRTVVVPVTVPVRVQAQPCRRTHFDQCEWLGQSRQEGEHDGAPTDFVRLRAALQDGRT